MRENMRKMAARGLEYLLSGELLFFLFLVSGQIKKILPFQRYVDFTMLCCVLTLLCVAYRGMQKKPLVSPFIKGLPVLAPYVGISLLMALSISWSISSVYAWQKLQSYVLLMGFTLLAAVEILDNRASLYRFFHIAIGYAALLAAQTIVVYFQDSFGRFVFIDALGTSYMQSSRMMTAGTILSLGLFMFSKGKRAAAYLALAAVTMWATLLSGARATTLLLPVCLAVFAILVFLKRLGAERKRFFIGAGALMLCLAILLQTPMARTFWSRTNVLLEQREDFWDDEEEAVFETLPAGYPGPVLTREEHGELGITIKYGNQIRNWLGYHDRKAQISRFRQLRYSVDMIRLHPLRGWGLGSYAVYVTNTEETRYPHNMFTEIWAECGLLALLAFVCMLFFPLMRLFRRWRRTQIDTPVLTVLLFVSLYWLTMTVLSAFVDGARILFALLGAACVYDYEGVSRKGGVPAC